MLLAFFDSKGMIYTRYKAKGIKANADYIVLMPLALYLVFEWLRSEPDSGNCEQVEFKLNARPTGFSAHGTKMTTVTKFVPVSKAGPFTRLIGSLDFKGQGTKHPLAELDPFILCDDSGSIQGKGKPPFGLHPHYGLIAVSTILEGAFADEDNLNGLSSDFNEAGGVYAVSAGQGVCHAETTQCEGPNRLIQTIVKIPQNKLDFPPETVKVKTADVPKIPLGGGFFSLLVGKLGMQQSPACLRALPRFILGRLVVEPMSSTSLPLDSDLEHGFAYVLKGGQGKLAGTDIVPEILQEKTGYRQPKDSLVGPHERRYQASQKL
eukprot:maker-scaffold319_size207808-snap-gene-1.17 protein:Tk00373 transcript:maker-scaffold319_size207808-snap-gene-1.17-mRNA-1 annotation:"predicted protein"